MERGFNPSQHDRIRALRDELSARLGERSAFSDTVYSDQPILMTANQLSQFVPSEVRQVREMAKDPAFRRLTVTERFVREAEVLAACSDEFTGKAEFSHYYPTYDDMNNDQLRTYLTWRARVRAGDVQPTSLSYAFVYLYELINQVGVNDARAGFDQLVAFGDEYRALDPAIGRYVDEWADAYVVYYDLPSSLLRKLPMRLEDEARLTVMQWEGASDDELYAALTRFSAYRVSASAFVTEHGDDYRKVAVSVFRVVAQHHTKLSRTLPDRLFGNRKPVIYQPFNRAIFSDPLKRGDYRYRIGPIDHVYCRAGAWTRVRYPAPRKAKTWVGDFLKTVDAIMRQEYGDTRELAAPMSTKYIVEAIRSKARELLRARREAQARAVHIDLGRLDAIRAAADVTRDRLIVEEEELDALDVRAAGARAAVELQAQSPATQVAVHPAEPMQERASGQAPEPEDAAQGTLYGLSSDEQSFLRVLLEGGSVRDFQREHGVMASLLAESVNEKLFDEFGDIVVDAAAEPPELIEDYVDGVRELLG
ncbi:TerB N-terminal domain-containing protein [Denitrobacterium detoxificans]|jgi:hypothetical protein|uniref:TerB N-terminal domain-containing protein n=1 Tax=Denitrobacterium detoxificans TaxID=79604 RepID=UPI0026EA1C98|nr:TerB N-terminal domain-containing protein [Denitrobacterium detoxificans]